MATENEKLFPDNKSQKADPDKANTKSNFGELVLRHKMITFLIAVLVILSLWAFIKISLLENKFKKETLKLKSDYENKIDSLTTKQLMV